MYPVISMTDACTHIGSRDNLLGQSPDNKLLQYYSSELQVKNDTPPTLLILADDDTAVSAENSIIMYQTLRKNKIPAEIHIISEGNHGFGLCTNNAHIATWTNYMKLWLNSLNK